jgi:hypothetical protein
MRIVFQSTAAIVGAFISLIIPTWAFASPPELIEANFNVSLLGEHNIYPSETLDVKGNIAYVAHHTSFELLDVSNPAQITSLGSCGIARPSDIAAENNTAFLAAGTMGLQMVDVSNPAAPAVVGNYPVTAPEGIGSVVVKNGRAYAADGNYGTITILDVSTPASPVRLGGFSFPGNRASVYFIENNLLYACATQEVRILDVSNPAQPSLVGSFFTGLPSGLAKSGNYLYVADSYRGLIVLDVTNPAAPLLKGYNYDNILKLNAFSGHVCIGGNRLYMAVGTGLCVFDITNPEKPALVGFRFFPKELSPFDLALVDGKVYSTDTVTMSVMEYTPGTGEGEGEGEGEGQYPGGMVMVPDVHLAHAVSEQLGYPGELTRENLAQLTALSAPAAAIQMLTGFEFCSGVNTLDLSGNNIQFIHELAHTESLEYLNLAGNHLQDIYPLVANTGMGSGVTIDLRSNPLGATALRRDIPILLQKGVQVLYDDVAPVGEPCEITNNVTLLGRFDTLTRAGSIAVSGTLAILRTSDEYQFLDITNPAQPVKIGSYPWWVNSPMSRTRFYNGRAFAAFGDRMKIFDVNAYPTPVEIGEFHWHGRNWQPYDFAFAGNLVYVAAYESLTILDISNIQSPTVKGVYEGGGARAVIVSGNLAYLATGPIEVLDVTNPEFPIRVRKFLAPDGMGITCIALDGHYLYA